MTPDEGRMDRIERNIEFLVQNQAQHDARIAANDAQISALAGLLGQQSDNIGKQADNIGKLVTVAQAHNAQIGELRAAIREETDARKRIEQTLAEVGDKLDSLSQIVDQWIRRHKNGDQQT